MITITYPNITIKYESCNNYFGWEKRKTILRQAKTDKHECRNICMLLLCCGTRASLLSSQEGLYCGFSTRSNSCEFLASEGVILESDHLSWYNESLFFLEVSTKSRSASKFGYAMVYTIYICVLCITICNGELKSTPLI